jgi:hypothetical protein
MGRGEKRLVVTLTIANNNRILGEKGRECEAYPQMMTGVTHTPRHTEDPEPSSRGDVQNI